MDIGEFNALDETEAVAVLETCALVPRWAACVVAFRPYETAEQLRTVADDAAYDWTPAEIEAALADHPRIGERHHGTGASAAHSAREQGTARTDDPEITARLEDGNRLYEKTFERVFLIRAAGRDAGEILAELHRRLDNDPHAELAETHDQLREIAVLRLAGSVS